MTKRILIPSAGGPGCVNLTRSLALLGDEVWTLGTDASPHYLHLALTDARELCLRRDDERSWVADLNGRIAGHGIDFVFPNNSLDGLMLARNLHEVSARTWLPSPEAFRVGEDKWATQQVLERVGIAVPRTWLIDGPEDLESIYAELTPPVWVRGSGIPGKGVGVASLPAKTLDQAIQWVEYWEGWGKMAASEFLPGRNLTWLGVFDRGRLIASQCRERDAYVIPHVSPSGITGAPAISHTVHRADINAIGPQVCRAIDPAFHGPAFVDFKEDGEGEPRVTEINVGRFGTTFHFYSAAGANFAELVLRLAFGESLPGWVSQYDVLPAGLYWIRTLDAGPVLTDERRLAEVLKSGRLSD
jgi:predicted ATP-grasp superfamily ATP-dependent carboligase